MSRLSFILVFFSILLFAVGYIAHTLWGDNNPVEQMAEEMLKEEYNIDVEFSGVKK
jgi:hypothetical protein